MKIALLAAAALAAAVLPAFAQQQTYIYRPPNGDIRIVGPQGTTIIHPNSSNVERYGPQTLPSTLRKPCGPIGCPAR